MLENIISALTTLKNKINETDFQNRQQYAYNLASFYQQEINKWKDIYLQAWIAVIQIKLVLITVTGGVLTYYFQSVNSSPKTEQVPIFQLIIPIIFLILLAAFVLFLGIWALAPIKAMENALEIPDNVKSLIYQFGYYIGLPEMGALKYTVIANIVFSIIVLLGCFSLIGYSLK